MGKINMCHHDDGLHKSRLTEKFEKLTINEVVDIAKNSDGDLLNILESKLGDLPDNFKYSFDGEEWDKAVESNKTYLEFIEDLQKTHKDFDFIVSKENGKILGWMAYSPLKKLVGNIKFGSLTYDPKERVSLLMDCKNQLVDFLEDYMTVMWFACKENKKVYSYYLNLIDEYKEKGYDSGVQKTNDYEFFYISRVNKYIESLNKRNKESKMRNEKENVGSYNKRLTENSAEDFISSELNSGFNSINGYSVKMPDGRYIKDKSCKRLLLTKDFERHARDTSESSWQGWSGGKFGKYVPLDQIPLDDPEYFTDNLEDAYIGGYVATGKGGYIRNINEIFKGSEIVEIKMDITVTPKDLGKADKIRESRMKESKSYDLIKKFAYLLNHSSAMKAQSLIQEWNDEIEYDPNGRYVIKFTRPCENWNVDWTGSYFNKGNDGHTHDVEDAFRCANLNDAAKIAASCVAHPFDPAGDVLEIVEYGDEKSEESELKESKMKESENWYDDMKAEKTKKEGTFIDTLQKKHPELRFESLDDIYFAYGVYDTDNNYLGKILLDTHYEFIPKRDCPEEIIKLFKKEGFGINLNVNKPWKESKMKEAFTKNENEITFPGEDLHSKLCEWLYSTADYYDLQDACEVGENPEEMTWNMSDKELVEAIIYTLNNQEEIWYMYTDDDPETSTARKDGEDLVKEYKYRARQMGRSNCDEWKVEGRLEKRNESNEYFHKERDGVYVARKVKDQKGKEDYDDWQKEYLGSKRRSRWVNSPLYAKRFKNEEDAQKYLDDYGKDDYYESKMKESIEIKGKDLLKDGKVIGEVYSDWVTTGDFGAIVDPKYRRDFEDIYKAVEAHFPERDSDNGPFIEWGEETEPYDQCASCGRDLDFGEGYTSRITGDALCQDCYDDESEWMKLAKDDDKDLWGKRKEFDESKKRKNKRMKESNEYCGVPGVRMIWHGEWADPEIEYKGKLYSYVDMEEFLLDYYREEHPEDRNDEGFDEWVNENPQEVYNVLYDLNPIEEEEEFDESKKRHGHRIKF